MQWVLTFFAFGYKCYTLCKRNSFQPQVNFSVSMERRWDVPVQGHGSIFLEAVLQSAEQDLELHVSCWLHLSHSAFLCLTFGTYVDLWVFSDPHAQRRACPNRRSDTTDFLLHGGHQPTNSLRIHSKEWLGGCYRVSQYSLELWLTTTNESL